VDTSGAAPPHHDHHPAAARSSGFFHVDPASTPLPPHSPGHHQVGGPKTKFIVIEDDENKLKYTLLSLIDLSVVQPVLSFPCGNMLRNLYLLP
jgi:hypothetical protein